MCDHKSGIVLIVDDCEDNLFLMDLLLTSNGYKIEKARCGKEAIVKAHQVVPDLIVLDFMMPDMTGSEVIASIKIHEHLSHIPIILCTANTFIGKDDVVGIDEICYKPFDITDMLGQIDSLVSCCEAAKKSLLLAIAPDDVELQRIGHQQLLFMLGDAYSSRDTWCQQGYEVFQLNS